MTPQRHRPFDSGYYARRTEKWQRCSITVGTAVSEASAVIYDLRVTVERIEGKSVCGLRVGDWFEVRHSSRLVLPPGRHFCIFALASILPLLPANQRQLSEGDWLGHDSLVSCPDPEERLVMRIERLRPREISLDELT